MASEDKIGALDFETDPFKVGRVPFPFAACVYFGENDYAVLWDLDSHTDFIARVVRALKRLPACTLYAHNGGKFDFHYLLEAAAPGTIQVRNGRIVQFKIGRVTLKDSFPLLPFALDVYKKTKIDYAIFEARRRNAPKNRARITSYLIDDCRNLRELVLGFRRIVGPRDTIGSAAFYQMKKHGITICNLNETHDDMFRPFYFGGRVQAFEKGIIRGPLKYLDINSAYPFAMRSHHAHGAEYRHSSRLPVNGSLGPSFVEGIFDTRGSLPVREADGALGFPTRRDVHAFATGWEIAAGLATRTLVVKKVINAWVPRTTICFAHYIDKFFALRSEAKARGDEIGRLAFKYLLNSGYGKFAQNPRDFKEYQLAPYGKNVRGFDWENDFGDISLWSRSSYTPGRGFYDVATGASITGYVRAMLWRAICRSKGVIYCDTDAMICRASQVPQGDALGRWKLEGIVKRAAIAGKKLYGVEWAKPQAGERYKIASKGARLDWPELLRLCAGERIIWENHAPTFSINGAHFIRREIEST